MIKKTNKIGILGGTFDPCHLGHLKISKEAKIKFKLSKIIWAITKKNPFKKISNTKLQQRIRASKKYTKKYKFINVNYFEKVMKLTTSKTPNLWMFNEEQKLRKYANVQEIIDTYYPIVIHKS